MPNNIIMADTTGAKPMYGVTRIEIGTNVDKGSTVVSGEFPDLEHLMLTSDNANVITEIAIDAKAGVSIESGCNAQNKGGALKTIDLHGGTAIIGTSTTYGMRFRGNLEVINAKCIMLTPNTNNQFTGANKLHTIYWQENEQTISVNIAACPLTEESLVSLANGLHYGSAATLYLSTQRKSMCNDIMGYVETVGTGDDAYEKFVQSASGTLSLTSFITVNKGWTLA